MKKINEKLNLYKKIVLALSIILVILVVMLLTFNNNVKNLEKNTSSNIKDVEPNIIIDNELKENPNIIIETNLGNIELELDIKNSPITVNNFLKYIENDFYSGTIFHRVIEGFMIQGGGFTNNLQQKKTLNPIKLESNNGLKNKKYTIAMARTNKVDSATSQFFINTKDNEFLDYSSLNPGYAVFGKVTKGFEIVDKIEKVKVSKTKISEAQPNELVIIKKIYLK